MRILRSDVASVVSECYAADCQVFPLRFGKITDFAGWQKMQDALFAAAPRRRLSISHKHASDDVVCLEAVLHDPDQGEDWALPLVALLTVRDGRVGTGRTYVDWSRWPRR